LIECYVQNSLYRKCSKRFAKLAKESAASYKETKVFVVGIAGTSSERNWAGGVVEILFGGNMVKTHN